MIWFGILAGALAHAACFGEFSNFSGDDAIGLVAVSRRQIETLARDGRLDTAEFFPFRDNPFVAVHLAENSDLEWNQVPPEAQLPRAMDRAWETSVAEILAERTTAGGGVIDHEPGFLDATAFFLQPEGDAGPRYAVDLDRLVKLPAYLGIPVAPSELMDLRVELNRDLSRALNMGPNVRDLMRWSALRAVAEAYDVRWTSRAGGPALEAALLEYFADLPRDAGVVLAIHAPALARVRWSTSDWPRVTDLTLGDVAAVFALGAEERALLKTLPTGAPPVHTK